MPEQNKGNIEVPTRNPSLDSDQSSRTPKKKGGFTFEAFFVPTMAFTGMGMAKNKKRLTLETFFVSTMAFVGIGLAIAAGIVALPVATIVLTALGAATILFATVAYITSMVLGAADRKKNKRNSAPSNSIAPKPELGEQAPQQSKSSSQSIDGNISSGGVSTSPVASFSSADGNAGSLNLTLKQERTGRLSSGSDAGISFLHRALGQGTVSRLAASVTIGSMPQAQGASQTPSSRLMANRPVTALQASGAIQQFVGPKPSAHSGHYLV